MPLSVWCGVTIHCRIAMYPLYWKLFEISFILLDSFEFHALVERKFRHQDEGIHKSHGDRMIKLPLKRLFKLSFQNVRSQVFTTTGLLILVSVFSLMSCHSKNCSFSIKLSSLVGRITCFYCWLVKSCTLMY